MRTIGYWCTRCEENDRKTFFFKKDGYCECLTELGEHMGDLGVVEGYVSTMVGYTPAQIKKCQKNWVPVFIKKP